MKDILYFYRLSRPLNVLISLIALALGAFISVGKNLEFLEDVQFWYGVIALTVITATGYWINDTFDFKIDRINKPEKVIVNAHLSVKKVFTAYFAAIAVVLGASLLLQEISLFVINCTAVGLLYVYAWFLKRTTIIGNLVIAALTGLVLYYAGVMFRLNDPLIWSIIFAFEVTFLREVTKDMEDIEGDLKFKLHTLPIRAGINVTKRVLIGAFVLFILSCYGPLFTEHLAGKPFNWLYLGVSLMLVQAPAVWTMRLLLRAESTEEFHAVSNWLKGLILLGMCSLILLQ